MNQTVYTKIFLAQNNQAVSEENIKIAKRRWWFNVRKKDSGGLRLTEEGLKFLKEDLDMAVYEVPFPYYLDLKPEVIVFLDRIMDCPYYLKSDSITVTNEKKCFELYLFSGDVQKYGLIKAMKRQRSLDRKAKSD
jgi:hypothetical protein